MTFCNLSAGAGDKSSVRLSGRTLRRRTHDQKPGLDKGRVGSVELVISTRAGKYILGRVQLT